MSTKVAQLEATGQRVNQEMVDALRLQYGLDKPVYLRYLTWMRRLLSGSPGMSLDWNRPVMELILERLPLTILLTGATLIFTYLVAIPIGIYSATHQYSLGDYTFTALGFVGLATPNFLLALILMYLLFKLFGISIGGLFSLEYARADWSLGKLLDMLSHLVAPIVVIGTAGTAWLIRVMRASLLDELRKQYVITARAKGVGGTLPAVQVPGAHRGEPDREHRGMAAAADRFRRDDHRTGVEPADHRATAAARAAGSGHVPGGYHRDLSDRADGHRNAAVGPAAGLARPAHSLRGLGERLTRHGGRLRDTRNLRRRRSAAIPIRRS